MSGSQSIILSKCLYSCVTMSGSRYPVGNKSMGVLTIDYKIFPFPNSQDQCSLCDSRYVYLVFLSVFVLIHQLRIRSLDNPRVLIAMMFTTREVTL